MNDETITLDDTTTVEILFTDTSGSYKALYTNGNLAKVTTESTCDVPLELDFTLVETFTHLNALGYEEGNRNNNFIINPPTKNDPVIRFTFIKGDTDEY
jgi:hypothetical protein